MKSKFVVGLGLALTIATPLSVTVLSAVPAYARAANAPIRTPKPGSRERAAIMNALRVPVAKEEGKRPTFTNVRNFRVGGGWAFLDCNAVDSKGHLLGPRDLPDMSALLKWNKGKWKVVEWGFHGDVVQIGWAMDHPDVPLNVLGLKPSDLS